MIRKLVLKPVVAMTNLADTLSKGSVTDEELKVDGNDEIADLTKSFNRMRRSVIKIIQLLNKTGKTTSKRSQPDA